MRTAPFALTLACACASPVDVAERLAEELSANELDPLRVAPEYRDAVGDRARLFADVDALSPMRVRFSELEAVRHDGGNTVIGKLEVELPRTPTWTFTGPLGLELGPDHRARTGLLTDLRELGSVAARRRAALEANDAAALGALLHPAYADGGLDRDGAIARLTADLAGARVRLEPSAYEAEVRGEQATLLERYTMTVGASTVSGVARFQLRREGGRWAIASGLYGGEPR